MMKAILPIMVLTACCWLPAGPGIAEKRLTPEQRVEVERMKERATFSRHVVHDVVATGPLYDHLMHHPDLVSRSIRALGLGPAVIEEEGPDRWRVADGHGATGTLELWANEGGHHIFVADLKTRTDRGRMIGAAVLFDVYLEDGRQNVLAHVRVKGVSELLVRVLLPFVGGYFDRRLDENFAAGREVLGRLVTETDPTLEVLSRARALKPGEAAILENLARKTVKLQP